jgi:hypothetical protein
VPAIVAFVAPQDPALLVLPAIAWIPLAIGWVVPGAAIRATGGVSDAKSDLDVVYGWLSPAADQLDVGDLEAARMQVDEARRHATPATMPYVELWDGLLTEELQRRMGRRVSRQARVDAINEEYARLVFAGDHVGPILQWSLVLGIAAVLILRLATIA